MLRKSLVTAAVLGVIVTSSPAYAGNKKHSSTSTSGWHTHSCKCGHIKCNTPPPPPPTTTSGTPPPPPTTSGTQVPEPGMLGLTGLGLMGLGALRMRRRRKVKRTIDLG